LLACEISILHDLGRHMETSLDSQAGSATPNSGALGRLHWKWMLGLGILFIVLGIIGLGMSFALTLATALAFGILLILSGALQIFDAFGRTGWKGIVWHVLIGLLYLAAGVSTVTNPVAASALFTALLAGMFIAVGIFRIILAWTNRQHRGWIWMLIAGLAALVLGGLLLAHWPVSGLFAIGLFIAIELLMQGWTLVLLALAARELAKG
jgi:uncharacterized membrane protein HdeD (DUF308 family)